MCRTITNNSGIYEQLTLFDKETKVYSQNFVLLSRIRKFHDAMSNSNFNLFSLKTNKAHLNCTFIPLVDDEQEFLICAHIFKVITVSVMFVHYLSETALMNFDDGPLIKQFIRNGKKAVV